MWCVNNVVVVSAFGSVKQFRKMWKQENGHVGSLYGWCGILTHINSLNQAQTTVFPSSLNYRCSMQISSIRTICFVQFCAMLSLTAWGLGHSSSENCKLCKLETLGVTRRWINGVGDTTTIHRGCYAAFFVTINTADGTSPENTTRVIICERNLPGKINLCKRGCVFLSTRDSERSQ